MKTGTYLFAILALCLIALPSLASEVIVAEEPTTIATTTPALPITPTPIPTLIPYITQGETVYVGDYIDISGVAPPYLYLAYWDGYDMYDSFPEYNITLPDGKTGYYKFYVDPAIFENRVGRWYKWDGKYENQGNNIAFTVMPKKTVNSTLTYPNGTSLNLSEIVSPEYNPLVIKPEPLLPEKHVADYVVAKGDDINWPVGGYHIWVLGRSDGIYDWPENTISKKQVETLENGMYLVIIQVPGNNTMYESRYQNNTLLPGLYGKKPIDVTGMAPTVVYEKMKEILKGTDDTLYEYNMEVDNPYITINRADEMFYYTKDVLDVRGYTNVANGTDITVSLDEKNTYYKNIPERTVHTTAVRTSNGNLSYFRAYVPIDYNDLVADATNHTLTARTALGGEVQKDFKISIMPPDSYKPNASLKYIEDRNPFVPTPTPEIVTVVKTQVVTQIVTVPVTPSNEVVYEQQRKAQDDITNGWVSLAVTAIVALVVLIGLGWYALRVWRRL